MHFSIIQRISSEYFRIFVLVSGHRYHAFYNIYRYNILHGSLYFSDTGTASGRSAVPGGTEFGDDGGHHRRNGADRSARFFARGDFRPVRRHGRCSGSRAGRRRADPRRCGSFSTDRPASAVVRRRAPCGCAIRQGWRPRSAGPSGFSASPTTVPSGRTTENSIAASWSGRATALRTDDGASPPGR